MDIKYDNGTYDMKLTETESRCVVSGSNIYRAKEMFMKYMSQTFDAAVDKQLGFMNEIQRLTDNK